MDDSKEFEITVTMIYLTHRELLVAGRETEIQAAIRPHKWSSNELEFLHIYELEL